MAFVQPNASAALRLSTFTPAAVDAPRRSGRCVTAASVRMASDEPRVVGVAGNSMWKEDLFAGGFPGGEAFFKKWIDDGMKDDVPDMPSFMQPSAEFKPVKPTPGTGVLAVLDRTEFFKDFVGQQTSDSDDEEDGDSESSSTASSSSITSIAELTAALQADVAPADILSTEIPDETLYEKFYPAATRNLAPVFEFDYDRKSESHQYDTVGMSMQPISASFTDVYYPKESKNNAPFIDIFYAGSLNAASVKMYMDEVDPLPTLPPPPTSNDTVVALRPGSGGGLKLNFESTAGEKILQ